MKQPQISKSLSLALVALVVGIASLAGCSGEPESVDPAIAEGVSTITSTAEPAAVSGTSAPANTSGSTNSAGLPKEIVFTDRVGFIGTFNALYKIELLKAEVIDAGGGRSAIVRTRVTNLANADSLLLSVKEPTLRAADGKLTTTRWDAGTIPGGGTTPVDITARVDNKFTFDGMSLIFGNVASQQTIIPLSETLRVTTFVPVVGVGMGRTATGSGVSAKITNGILHDDFTEGSKNTYQLELAVEVSFRDSANTLRHLEATFTLTAPDGTSTVSDRGFVFFSNDSDVVESGKTARLGLKFRISSTYYGQYKLSVNDRRLRVENDPGAVLTFEVARVVGGGSGR